jgi:flagellum-specific peptidoglycan hydrolase FlgJ
MSTAIKKFFSTYKAEAIKAAAGSKVFPETILSAAYVESAGGKSLLTSKYNNFFGVKASSSWKGETVALNTKEQTKDGKVYTIKQDFRVYKTPADSFKDYVSFVSGPRYKKAGVLTAATPEAQIKAIKAAGYATAVNYAEILIKVLKSSGYAAVSLVTIFAAALFFGLINK